LWDVTPCGSFKNRRFGGTYRLHRQGEENQRDRIALAELLVTANVLKSRIFFALMMETISSSETLLLTRAARRYMP
jgi:hypothetical protein